jgi:hypothetical protein
VERPFSAWRCQSIEEWLKQDRPGGLNAGIIGSVNAMPTGGTVPPVLCYLGRMDGILDHGVALWTRPSIIP